MIVLYVKSLILIQAEMSSKNEDNLTDINRMWCDRCLRSLSVINSVIKRKVPVDLMQRLLQILIMFMLFGRYLHALFAFWHIHLWNQDYHDIDLDKKLSQKQRNRNDSQKISRKLFFLLKTTYAVQSLYKDIVSW